MSDGDDGCGCSTIVGLLIGAGAVLVAIAIPPAGMGIVTIIVVVGLAKLLGAALGVHGPGNYD